jgi:hypothetical protein
VQQHQFLRGSVIPASVSSRVARPDSPVPYSDCFIVIWPTALPISMPTRTSTTHPVIAMIRCRALQPPSLAARLD